jgi:small subunit ribosomal protein S9
MPQAEEFIATGRRKTSVARVRMMPGSGKIDINGRPFEDYFPTVPLQNVVLQPLQNAKSVNTYDLFIHANGGGIMGQAGAAQLAIARALLASPSQIRGFVATRPAHERAQEIRPTRRAKEVPILETLAEQRL